MSLTSGGAPATATAAGSPYSIVPSAAVFSPAGAAGNYNISYANGSFTVTAATLDITANNQSKSYGTAFTFIGNEFSLVAGQLKNGDTVASVTLTSAGAAATANVGGSPYTITASAAVFAPAVASGNYNITYHNGSFTVNAAQLDITASNQSKTYGTAFTFAGNEFTTGASQLKNGDTVAGVTLTSAGAAATANVTGSPYTITASAAVLAPAGAANNYSIAYHDGSFTVNPAPLDVTATNESKNYGDAFAPNGATQFSTSPGQLKNGDLVASVTLTSGGYAATATVAGSPYTITPSVAVFTPAVASSSYAITYHVGQLTVNAAPLDITATNESKTYGDAFSPNGATQFSTSPGQLKNGDVVASVTLTSGGYAATATVAGSPYTITPSAAVFTPAVASGNYAITYHSGQFTVNPAPLDITATNESKTYGDTFTPNGTTQFSTGSGQLKNSDVVASVTLTSTGYAATATVANSPYAINVSAAVFTPASADTNYVITYHSGSLAVNPAALDITATNESKTYGDTFTPNGATQFSTAPGQLKNGDLVASVTLTSTGYAATATVANSPYAINVSAAVFTPASADTNYVITYHSGSLAVNAAQLDITATNESKTYGDTFTPNGATQFSTGSGQLKNGDVVASVMLTSSGYAPTAMVANSPFTITASAAVFAPAGASANYNITYHNGSFTVNPAQLDVTATNESKTYGDTFSPNGATQFSTGPGQLKNGDVVASVTLSSTGYAPGADVAGSPYTITASAAVFTPMGAGGNYAITYHTGSFTVNAAQLDITATNESKTYGDTFTPNGATQFRPTPGS